MKIDTRNPEHWLRLAAFGLAVACALVARPFRRRAQRKRVLFYGHKLAGNLKPIYAEIRAGNAPGMEAAYLTMDVAYHRRLVAAGEASVLAGSAASIRWLASADAIVTDHGLHAMLPLLYWSGIKFFDTWHGIPFKGFDATDFQVQHRYDETWVASDLCRDLYVDRFGFDSTRVCSTGYARTDRLVKRHENSTVLRESLGIPQARKTILFAPTWAQDDRGRSIYPFGCSEQEFVGVLSAFADAHHATILLRSHLNTGRGPESLHSRVIALPGSRYPDTEAILLVSDVLVCDWSSIAFDFLLLQRPTVFLDVPPPFRKGFSLGPEYRFGAIARDLEELTQQLKICVQDAEAYWHAHAGTHQQISAKVYGNTADGRSAARCMKRLQASLGENAA